MPATIKVEYKPDEDLAGGLRVLVCQIAANREKDYNPLTKTSFNRQLDEICQIAFEEGLKFERKHPKLSNGRN